MVNAVVPTPSSRRGAAVGEGDQRQEPDRAADAEVLVQPDRRRPRRPADVRRRGDPPRVHDRRGRRRAGRRSSRSASPTGASTPGCIERDGCAHRGRRSARPAAGGVPVARAGLVEPAAAAQRRRRRAVHGGGRPRRRAGARRGVRAGRRPGRRGAAAGGGARGSPSRARLRGRQRDPQARHQPRRARATSSRCSAGRPDRPSRDLAAGATRLVLAEAIDNPANIGAIVRNAAGTGWDGLVLDRTERRPAVAAGRCACRWAMRSASRTPGRSTSRRRSPSSRQPASRSPRSTPEGGVELREVIAAGADRARGRRGAGRASARRSSRPPTSGSASRCRRASTR